MKRTEKRGGYHANHNTVYKCYFHITFTPKYRRKVLVGPVAARLDTLLREKCSEMEATVVELAIESDHVTS